ncbi:MAG: IPT/TIG domain-containing protein [Methanoregula sp.]
MDKSSGIILLFLALLVTGVFIAGCSSDTAAPAATAQPAVTTAAATSGALYSAGDIIKNPKSTSNSALLIIGYDAGSDTYERAYIYPNSDGSWGYRMDSKTEKISRSTLEKIYTQKVTKKTVSAVPISTPTPAVLPTEVYTTTITTASATASTTTSSTGLPKIMAVPDPDEGKTGTTVSITELKGLNFVSGATITLVKTGSPSIIATNVNVQSGNLITCTLVIPVNATIGIWDIVVKNPDGQYHQYNNSFTVRQGSTTTTTTTSTTTTSASSPTITNNDPSTAVGAGYYPITITGSNFRNGLTAKLTLSGKSDITATECSLFNEARTEMRCFFTLPEGSAGLWTLVVSNSDATSATRSDAFRVYT